MADKFKVTFTNNIGNEKVIKNEALQRGKSNVPMNSETIDHEANELLDGLGLSKTSESLEISLNGAKNLGISLDETIDASRIEASLIGHILLADVSGSQ